MIRRRTLRGMAAAALAVLALACESSGGGPTTSRSEQVVASTAPPTAEAPAAPSSAPHAAPPPLRATKLCAGDGNAKGRALPKLTLAHLEASGAAPLDGAMPPATGTWTWVNLWAAWCGPCKEEMPRLRAWQDKLARAGTPVRLLFVSLDDDRRQLQGFLDGQPPDGLRSSLWLPEGSNRASFLSGLRVKSAPELPEQVLFDANNKPRCFVQGAVEEGDYDEIAALVSR